MIALLLNLAWGLVVLLSFVALGRPMARVLRTTGSWDISMAAGWGMAGMVALGGWLNLLGLARASVLMALVLSVIALGLLYEGRKFLGSVEHAPAPPEESPERGKWIWVVLLAILITIKYVTSLGLRFMRNDDQPAYLLQLSRMLQTGSIGRDPFSMRQLLSLNGQTFLLGLVGSVSPLKYAFLLDPGICWIMIAGLAWFFVRRDLGASIRYSCLSSGLVLMVNVPEDVGLNLGGDLTATALYLTLFRMAFGSCGDKGSLNRGSLVLLACTVAALCALKMTFLMYAILFLVSWYGLRMPHSPRLALAREFSLVGLVVCALLLPWMWQQYRSGGTPLYPFLGTGYLQAELLGDPFRRKAMAVLCLFGTPAVGLVILGLVLLVYEPWENRCRWRIFFASLFSILIGSSLLVFQIVNPKAVRYMYPVVYAGLIPLGLYGFFSRWYSRAGKGLALCLAIFVAAHWENLYTSMGGLRDFLRAGPYGFLVKDQVVQRLRNAQASIPPGKRILAGLQDGYLLDLARNPTWSLDNPGIASPPPGLPITTDSAALRDVLMARTTELPPHSPSSLTLDYLRRVGIDFLVFQRGPGENSPWYLRWRGTLGNDSTWYLRKREPIFRSWAVPDRAIRVYAWLVHDQLLELMSKCPKPYDDGDLVVLDLRNEQ